RERGLGVRPVGEQHPRDVTARLLAAVLRPAPRDGFPQALARESASRLWQVEEEHVAALLEQASRRQLSADRLDERVAKREDTHELELRLLAQPAERARAAQQEPRDRAPRPVHPRHECLDRGVGLTSAARELRVRRDGTGAESLVVRDRAEQVRRVFRPAMETEVDLGDRPMAVPGEERGELPLEEGWQPAGTVLIGELRGRALGERAPAGGVVARVARDAPELEI